MTSITDILNKSVVVFSKNYLPIGRVNIKRAIALRSNIALLVTGKAEPLDFSTDDMGDTCIAVRSPSLVMQVPTQIRLTFTGNERIWKVPPVNRREVLRRDRHQCQYCGSHKNLTLDRVIPRSKGGSHTWDNVVIACNSCNSRKGDRTPQQAGMPLLTKPRAPIHPE